MDLFYTFWLCVLMVNCVVHETETGIITQHRHDRSRIPGRRERPGRRPNDKKDSLRYTLSEVEEPLSRQRVRLRGNSSSYNAGLVEVYRGAKWGIICDDHWTKENADVVCKQLGFSLGAVSSLSNAAFGSGMWTNEDILMDEVNCEGGESMIHHCPYLTNHDCTVSEAASVVCHTTPGCPPGWFGGWSSCYKLVFSPNVRNRRDAERNCSGSDAFLAIIETQKENNFLSDTLMSHNPDLHTWMVGGKRHHGVWVWINVDRHVTSRRFNWELFPISQYRQPSTALREYSNIDFTDWFPGWQPTNYGAEPSYDKLEVCVGLVNHYELPNGTMASVNYYFWDDIICRNKRGLHFICEKKTISNTETEEIDCYTGNGTDYAGTVSVTEGGSKCLPWTSSTITNPDTDPNKGLGHHRYCRNPDDDNKPWCWVDVHKNIFGYCAVSVCGYTPATPETTSTMTTIGEPEELDCPQRQFYCSESLKCITNKWRCDGEADCEYEEDENGCSYFLDSYEKFPNLAMVSQDRERYSGVPLEMCARLCMETQGYVCRSLSYNYRNRSCFLSEANIQMVGIPPPSEIYDYYELRSQTLNCTDQFRCINGKCVQLSYVCNMADDCGDFSDEDGCGIDPAIQVRLAGGTEYSGRVEINYRGEWGIICDDKWDVRDARVICRILGFPNAVQATTRAEFGEGNGNILLDEVECLGNESSLEECPKSGWKEHDCRPYEAAGVICLNINTKACAIDEFSCATGKCISAVYVCNSNDDCGDNGDEEDCDVRIELVDGESELNGRVEIIRNGLRGTVCDDGWNDADAGVVCKMLGHHYGGIAHDGSGTGAGNGLIWVDDVSCTGDEDFLFECLHSQWGMHNCEHHEDAWLTCRDEPEVVPAEGITIELVGGSSDNEGRVEIIRYGIRGTVCDDRWDYADAEVVCHMLGYNDGIAIKSDVFGPGSDTSPIFLDEVACVGTESSITECGEINWGVSDCSHSEDAGVRCGFPINEGSPDGGDQDTRPSVLPTECGRIPLEEQQRELAPSRRKRSDYVDGDEDDEFDWPEKELDEKPKFEKVIGGQTADYGSYPWQVGIRRIINYEMSDGSQFTSHWCGGTILSEFWILSAAHCYESLGKSNILVRTGDLNNKIQDNYEQEFEVEQLLTHELYDGDAFDFDIALIKIKHQDGHGIIFNDYVQPACLPDNTTVYQPGTSCHISGWGRTDFGYPNLLKKAQVPIIDESECQNLYKGELTPRMFCAGIIEGGIDTCSGDSGGPFVCGISGVYTVLGATSWGNECAKPNSPGVYSHVQVLLPWIRNKIQNYS